MAATEVAVANMALSMLGQTAQLTGTTIVSAGTATKAAQQVLVWYAQSRQWAYRDYSWGHARRFAEMTLVDEDDGTQAWSGRWRYQYRYPTSALYVHAVRFPGEDRKTAPPNEYEISADATAKLVYTNVGVPTDGDAIAEYTIDVSDTLLFDPKFEAALAGLLAFRLAPGLSADPTRAGLAWNVYQSEKLSAQRSDANEGENGEEPNGSFVTSHWGG